MIKTYDISCSEKEFDLQKCRESAESGYAEAQYNLARCYAEGTRIGVNWNEAAKWYKAAAKQGHADAMHIVSSVTFFDCYKFKWKWILVEMVIDEFSDKINLNHFLVPEDGRLKLDWQIAYLEQYLNTDGTEKICDLSETPQPSVRPCRIAFFIYKKRAGKVLRTPYGEFSIQEPKKLPERLKKIIEFKKT